MPNSSTIVLADVSFGYDPHGEPLLDSLNAAIPPGRTGIIGRNGSGKSTLLRLLTGELSPTGGSVSIPSTVATLPQNLLQHPSGTVAEILGIDKIIEALRAIESGSLKQADFDAVGNDWDIESRALALLSRWVPSLTEATRGNVLERPVGTLSGGELMLAAMLGLNLVTADITILDEPTNNLDRGARQALYAAIESWPGNLVVVSHDIGLLALMDQICELHDGALRVFGGNYEAYQNQLNAIEAAAKQALRTAEQELRVQRREREHVQTAMARRAAMNRKSFGRVAGGPRSSDPTAKRAAQARRAGEIKRAAAKVRQAQERVAQAESALRDDDSIRLSIVDPGTASGHRLAELVGVNQTIHLSGGDRVGLVGDNGVGKTTLLRQLLLSAENDSSRATSRSARIGAPTAHLMTRRFGYLDQQLDMTDDATALDLIGRAAPGRLPSEIRGQLASFLLRGDRVDQPVGSLSGGERFRVAFARLLLAEQAPELLILDEPTNNLDLDSIDQLVAGLNAYRGALLVVSHDDAVLERLQLDRVIELDRSGNLLT